MEALIFKLGLDVAGLSQKIGQVTVMEVAGSVNVCLHVLNLFIPFFISMIGTIGKPHMSAYIAIGSLVIVS